MAVCFIAMSFLVKPLDIIRITIVNKYSFSIALLSFHQPSFIEPSGQMCLLYLFCCSDWYFWLSWRIIFYASIRLWICWNFYCSWICLLWISLFLFDWWFWLQLRINWETFGCLLLISLMPILKVNMTLMAFKDYLYFFCYYTSF